MAAPPDPSDWEHMDPEDFHTVYISPHLSVIVRMGTDSKPFVRLQSTKLNSKFRFAVFQREWGPLMEKRHQVLDGMKEVRNDTVKYCSVPISSGLRIVISKWNNWIQLTLCRGTQKLYVTEDEWSKLVMNMDSVATRLNMLESEVSRTNISNQRKRMMPDDGMEDGTGNPSKRQKCSGCEENLPSQLDHMGHGGCMAEI